MVVKKTFSTLVSTLLVGALLLTGCGSKPSASDEGAKKPVPEKTQTVKIGITQIAEHPALDAARKGFIEALESKGFKDGENIKIEYQNAQGDAPTSDTIAKNFVSGKVDLILAVATPSAQSAYNVTKDIPILITAVTDPVKSGLAKSWDKPDTNVTGTSDATPIDKQMELLKKLVPEAKKVGIIFNTSEANSEIQVEDAKNAASKLNMEIVTSGVTTTNDIPQALDSLLSKVDALYLPTDNLIASAMPIVASKCIEKKKVVIGGEAGMVEGGALATEGIDYGRLGFQTGLMAAEVLNGKNPKDMAIETLKDTELVINETTANKLGITIPEDIKSRAKMTKGGE